MPTRTLYAVTLTLTVAIAGTASPAFAQASRQYDELVALFGDFRSARAPAVWSAAFDDPQAPYGVADYSSAAVAARITEIDAFEQRLRSVDYGAWTVAEKADFLAVKAQIAAERFHLEVSRPWARDPGTYVDPILRLAFSNVEAGDAGIERIRERLEAVPYIIRAAQANLTDGAADFLALARFNMREPDGVGHGHPYRAVPPAGVIGWYEDLRERAVASRPDLVPVVDDALAAVVEFADWLDAAVPRMTAQGGVGEARFDWYMRNAKLLPWTADEMALLATRDWERLMGFLALEEARNRHLPELEPARSAEEYDARLRRTDENVRRWLAEAEILTLPDDTPDFDGFGYNVPFIERPEGLNFWEKVQFRDPHPDHLHAVIPGHRYDGWFAGRSDHPIRSRISDGVRVEGWGVYLEEPMVRAGVIDHLPRVQELMYLFGIFRATRVTADIGMQLGEMTITEGADHMRERSPWLDDDVARVDAEIYLRRPPGYGLGYTIGNLQLQQLLGEMRSRDGEAFELRAFHDEFLSKGRIPISLIRFEMLGSEDQVSDFWDFEPIPPAG
ncbi:MAG: DUF885 family protein [Gemmatimonadetes bacterium]|nr:DUF885 family protein [Gemmatimonadota bacterium]